MQVMRLLDDGSQGDWLPKPHKGRGRLPYNRCLCDMEKFSDLCHCSICIARTHLDCMPLMLATHLSRQYTSQMQWQCLGSNDRLAHRQG